MMNPWEFTIIFFPQTHINPKRAKPRIQTLKPLMTTNFNILHEDLKFLDICYICDFILIIYSTSANTSQIKTLADTLWFTLNAHVDCIKVKECQQFIVCLRITLSRHDIALQAWFNRQVGYDVAARPALDRDLSGLRFDARCWYHNPWDLY